VTKVGMSITIPDVKREQLLKAITRIEAEQHHE
jgi:hypothetical protein